MESGIVHSFQHQPHKGNFWVLTSVDKIQAAEFVRECCGGTVPQLAAKKAAESLSAPVHKILQVTKIKILFLAANPKGTDPLALDKECREIENKIRASEHRDSFELVSKWAVRTSDLIQYLNQHRAHIIHFSGHGDENDELVLADSQDEPKSVTKPALKQLFATLKDNVKLVVLNACFSRSQAEVITEVIDCAIGMNKSIGDEAAILFAAHFYQALGFGRSVKKAFESGKLALMLEQIPEDQTPELLVRKGVDADSVFLFKADDSGGATGSK